MNRAFTISQDSTTDTPNPASIMVFAKTGTRTNCVTQSRTPVTMYTLDTVMNTDHNYDGSAGSVCGYTIVYFNHMNPSGDAQETVFHANSYYWMPPPSDGNCLGGTFNTAGAWTFTDTD